MDKHTLIGTYRPEMAVAEMRCWAANAFRILSHERSNELILSQTEDMAAMIMEHMYRQVNLCTNYRDSDNPRAVACWRLACEIQIMMTGTDPEDAAFE